VTERIDQSIEAWQVAQGHGRADLERIRRVSRGQISRILAGNVSQLGPEIRRLCATAGVDGEGGNTLNHQQALR